MTEKTTATSRRSHHKNRLSAPYTAEKIREFIDSVPKDLFIDGEFVPGSDDKKLSVTNPADGSELCQVASATEADARRALEAAVRAQESWAATSPQERATILMRAFELLLEHEEELALLQTLELGRALKDSRGEVTYGAEFFRWFAGEATRITGDYRVNPAGNSRIVVHRQPVGVTLAVTPWNFPLAMGTRKLGPALAAGCTMIIKPASKTPLTMLYLAKLLKDAGLPDGVVAVLPTTSARNVSALLDDNRVRKFTFTGSTEVGQMLAEKAAANTIKTSLELGGNAPFIVFNDADIDNAVEAALTAKMRGAGQVCIAANRFLIHKDVAEEFTTKLVDKFAKLTVGVGYADGVDVGPLSGDDQKETVSNLVDDAVSKGARVRLGGKEQLPKDLPKDGFYYPVTVLDQIPDDADIKKEEIFGPVVAIYTFNDFAEAIAAANDTPFGLAAYVFSENLTTALKAAEDVDAGMVAVNKGALSDPAAPFGGVKTSGLGREGGLEGIDEFLETKFISLPL